MCLQQGLLWYFNDIIPTLTRARFSDSHTHMATNDVAFDFSLFQSDGISALKSKTDWKTILFYLHLQALKPIPNLVQSHSQIISSE